jgi:hypothetical protein
MLANKIENVQELLEAEMMAAKKQFEVADRKLESEFNHQISQAHLRMDESASRVEGIRVEVDTRVNQLGIKVTQVDSKLGSLGNKINFARNNVQENADEILRRQRESAEQIQVEMQTEKEIVERRIEELRSERVSRD